MGRCTFVYVSVVCVCVCVCVCQCVLHTELPDCHCISCCQGEPFSTMLVSVGGEHKVQQSICDSELATMVGCMNGRSKLS